VSCFFLSPALQESDHVGSRQPPAAAGNEFVGVLWGIDRKERGDLLEAGESIPQDAYAERSLRRQVGDDGAQVAIEPEGAELKFFFF
jgi:hypothetical protein